MTAETSGRLPGAAFEQRDEPEGLVALVLVQLCFALFPVFVKWAYAGGAFSPGAVAAWRLLFGAAALLALTACARGTRVLPPARDLPRLLACAALGVVLNQGLYLHGMQSATAVSAGLLMCLIPAFTYALAVAARQERLSATRTAGVLAALLGAAVLVAPDLRAAQASPDGSPLLVVNALSYSAYLVVSKPLLMRHRPLEVIAWVYALSAPAAAWFASGERMLPEALAGHERALLGLVLILLLPTLLGYLLGAHALKRTRASTSAAFVVLQPFLTALAAVVLLGERISAEAVLASVPLVAGLWLVTRPSGPLPVSR